ncbi:hypothetical protein LguiB_010676 [Lonicera macranthoides]
MGLGFEFSFKSLSIWGILYAFCHKIRVSTSKFEGVGLPHTVEDRGDKYVGYVSMERGA